MHPTRREMLRLGLGSSALLACGPTVPLFLARSAHAMAGAANAKGRILVVVQLDGGNDGLNTVVPYRDDEYRKRRPRIQIGAGEVRKVDDHVGLHPSLEGFSKLLEQQQLAIVQGVGYPNPNRSHFESMAIWQTARLDADKAAPGWLARSIDRRPGSEGDAAALHIHESLPLPQSLAGGRQVIPSLARLEQFRRRLGVPETADPAAQVAALDRLARQDRGEAGSLLQFVERCSVITYASSARLERLGNDKSSTASTYPEFYGLARRLRLIAQLIKAGLSTSIYYTHLDGFDTHSGQLQTHATLLRELRTLARCIRRRPGEIGRVRPGAGPGLLRVRPSPGRERQRRHRPRHRGPRLPAGQTGQAGPARALPGPDPSRRRRRSQACDRLPRRLCVGPRPMAGRTPSRHPRRHLRAGADSGLRGCESFDPRQQIPNSEWIISHLATLPIVIILQNRYSLNFLFDRIRLYALLDGVPVGEGSRSIDNSRLDCYGPQVPARAFGGICPISPAKEGVLSSRSDRDDSRSGRSRTLRD